MDTAREIRKELLTETECAHLIGFSRIFLRKARCQGNLPGHTDAPDYIRVGKRSIRYRRSTVIEWMDRHEQSSSRTP